MRDGVAGNLIGVPSRTNQENDAIPKIAPKWLKYDRHVGITFQYIRIRSAILMEIIQFYISEFKFLL